MEEIFRFNPWWATGRVPDGLLFEFKRDLFYKLIKQIETRQIILLTGMRRVGKTVLIYQIINELLKKVNPKNILYFSFDVSRSKIDDILKIYHNEILNKEIGEERVYIFFDEIQKADDWANKIKVYYDLYPMLKFFLTGSASLILQKKSAESLAGRVFEFTLPILSFREFLKMMGKEFDLSNPKLIAPQILPLFFDFIKKGGFPELTFEEDDEKIKMYFKNSVIDRIIYKDLPLEFGLKDFELLENLLKLFFSSPGLMISYENLSNQFNRDRRTIANYIHYLKYAMLIKILSNFRKGTLTSSRKNRKIYPSSTGFIFMENMHKMTGEILETFIINEINPQNYFRKNQTEIDIILRKGDKIIPIECKLKADKVSVRKFKKALKKLDVKEGYLITLEDFGEIKEDVSIKIMPAFYFVLADAGKEFA